MMSPIAAFILGLLIGWLIEWIIDWLYWRRRREQRLMGSRSMSLEKQAALEAELASNKEDIRFLQERVRELEAEKARLESLSVQTQTDLDATRLQPAVAEPPAPDDLEVINGIGPVIARQLNEAGIFTFEQLAAQTPEFLRNTLGDAVQRLADEESLLTQARQLAQQKQVKGAGEQ
jgi:predicted flap endonuclease-1-like 5' DNA nuclease